MVSATGTKQSLVTGAARRDAIVAVVADYWTDYDRAPSYSELARAVGLRSKNAVREHIEWLVNEGRLTKEPLRVGEPTETVKFALDGTTFEAELTEPKAALLRERLAPYIAASHRQRRRKAASP